MKNDYASFSEIKIFINSSLKLSLPLFVFQLSSAIGAFFVAVILSRLGSQMAAAYSIISSISMTFNILVLGVLSTVGVNYSYNIGANNHSTSQSIYNTGFYLSIALAMAIMLIYFFLPSIILLFGIQKEIVDLAASYFSIFSLSLPAYCLGVFYIQLFISSKNTKLLMYFNSISFTFLVVLTYYLVNGYFQGISSGISGAALANLVITWLLLPVLMLFCSYKNPEFKLQKVMAGFNFKKVIDFFKMGFMISMALLIEVIVHVFNSIIAGSNGIESQAIYLFFMQTLILAIIFPFSLSRIVMVSIGHAYGANKPEDFFKIISANLLIILVYQLIITCIFWVFSKDIINLFFNIENNPMLRYANLKNIILVMLFIVISESMRLILVAALRGIQEVKAPMWISVFCFIFLGCGSGWVLITYSNLDAVGLALGILIGSISSTLMLFFRYFFKNKEKFLMIKEKHYV